MNTTFPLNALRGNNFGGGLIEISFSERAHTVYHAFRLGEHPDMVQCVYIINDHLTVFAYVSLMRFGGCVSLAWGRQQGILKISCDLHEYPCTYNYPLQGYV